MTELLSNEFGLCLLIGLVLFAVVMGVSSLYKHWCAQREARYRLNEEVINTPGAMSTACYYDGCRGHDRCACKAHVRAVS